MISALLAWSASASDRFTVGPEPDWVDELPLDLGWSPPPGTAEAGVDWLLVDTQTSRSGERIAAYSRWAKRITSSSGLDASSQVGFTWEPTFEDLRVHTIRLHRDGAVLDRLDPRRLQVFQRETGLEARLYDGSLSVVLLLDDLRVGDVLEVASSWTGRNPVFDGRYGGAFQTSWPGPIHRVRQRFVWPEDRELHVRTLYGAPSPALVVHDGSVERSWDLVDPIAVADEDLVPSWFSPHGVVQLSEDDTWADVARWGVELHQLPPRLGQPLRDQIDRWVDQATDDEDLLERVLDFVQDEIRYVGIEIGEGTHRPAPPDVVYERRFGDCKDKTLLLVASLRAIGIEAWPAMVNTVAGPSIDDWQPTRQAFDHVIAAVMLDGELLFVDPTRSSQGGRPSDRAPPPWQRALIVRPETTRLTPIPQALPAEPDIDIDERWTLSGADDSATVRIETRYRAAEADRVRGELHHRSAEDMSRQYLNYYLTMYPGIRAVGPIASRDDPAENVVVTTEDYAVPAIWTVAADGRSQQLDLVASGIRDLLRVPTIRQRALPLAVPYPVFVRQAMHVTMPSGFTIPAETVRIDRQELAVERTLAVQGDTLELGLELKTLRDVVEPAAVEGHLQALDQVFVASVFSLTRPTPGLVLPWRPHWPAFVVAFVSSVAAAIAAGAVYWRASRPRPALVAPGPSGIGGWLLLPAIGLLVTPIRMFSLTEEMLPLFDANVVEALTPPWLRVGILTELAFNLTTFVWWGLLATLFVEKRRELPPVIIVFLVFQAVALVGDFWLTSLVLPSVPGDGSPASGAVIRAIIWGSYFAASKRVKATFVR